MKRDRLESIIFLSAVKLLTQACRLPVLFCLFCYNVSVAVQPLCKKTQICTASRKDITTATPNRKSILRKLFTLVLKVNIIHSTTGKRSELSEEDSYQRVFLTKLFVRHQR